MPQRDYSEVARAFVKEARVDLRSARLLGDGSEHSRAVAACQQAVEKAVWMPSDSYSEGDANEAIADADWVIQEIVTFIEQEYHLKLREG